jgi:plasmid stabilization system protein ParE
MAYKITPSKIFMRKVVAVNTYLENEWNFAVAVAFLSKLKKTILVISEQPGCDSLSAKKQNVRKLIVTKHNKIYYRVKDNDEIVLLALWDTRLNPRKNRYE